MKKRCIKCFRVLSVPARFKIFEQIKKHNGKVNITSLVKYIKLRQPTVTFHVNALVEAGIIKKYKEGRVVWCQVKSVCNDCLLFSP